MDLRDKLLENIKKLKEAIKAVRERLNPTNPVPVPKPVKPPKEEK